MLHQFSLIRYWFIYLLNKMCTNLQLVSQAYVCNIIITTLFKMTSMYWELNLCVSFSRLLYNLYITNGTAASNITELLAGMHHGQDIKNDVRDTIIYYEGGLKMSETFSKLLNKLYKHTENKHNSCNIFVSLLTLMVDKLLQLLS